MKKILFLLLMLVAASCSITTETTATSRINCWKNRICEGDTYVYRHLPRPGGGYTVVNVQIIEVQNNRVLIQHSGNKREWVRVNDFDRHNTPIKVHHDNGKHKGHYK